MRSVIAACLSLIQFGKRQMDPPEQPLAALRGRCCRRTPERCLDFVEYLARCPPRAVPRLLQPEQHFSSEVPQARDDSFAGAIGGGCDQSVHDLECQVGIATSECDLGSRTCGNPPWSALE